MLNTFRLSYLPMLIVTVLTGCNSGGGESGGQDSSDTQPTQLLATQTRSVVDIENPLQQLVDLGDAVEVIGGSSATLGNSNVVLSNVVSLSEESQCSNVSINGDTLSFSTSYDTPATCVLEYTVQSDDGIEASDIVQIDATKVIPVIPKFFDTLHVNMALNGPTSVDIDLDTLLNVPAGFVLDTPNITVTGAGTATGSGNKITFVAGQASGVNEIFYSMENAKQGLAISGAIRVMVSEDASTAPINSEPNKDVGQKEVYKEFEVNLSDFITAQSGEPLQLIDVNRDPYTEVSVKDSMKIAITPTLPGKSQISYIVTDHNGGSVTGSINFEGKQYQDKVVGGGLTQPLLLARPVLHSIYSQSTESPVAEYMDYLTGYKIANVTWNEANDYCSSLGMQLPIAADMMEFTASNLFAQHQWATTNHYWSSTTVHLGEHESIRLEDGHRISSADTELRGVVCIAPIPPNTPPAAQDITETGEIYNVKTITVSATDAEGQRVEISDVISDDEIDVQINGLDLELTPYTKKTHRLSVVLRDVRGAESSVEVDLTANSNNIGLLRNFNHLSPILLSFDAEQLGYNPTVSNQTADGYYIASISTMDAIGYCQQQGLELPSKDTLDLIVSSANGQSIATLTGWQGDIHIASSSGGEVYNLGSGVVSSSSQAGVTCIATIDPQDIYIEAPSVVTDSTASSQRQYAKAYGKSLNTGSTIQFDSNLGTWTAHNGTVNVQSDGLLTWKANGSYEIRWSPSNSSSLEYQGYGESIRRENLLEIVSENCTRYKKSEGGYAYIYKLTVKAPDGLADAANLYLQSLRGLFYDAYDQSIITGHVFFSGFKEGATMNMELRKDYHSSVYYSKRQYQLHVKGDSYIYSSPKLKCSAVSSPPP